MSLPFANCCCRSPPLSAAVLCGAALRELLLSAAPSFIHASFFLELLNSSSVWCTRFVCALALIADWVWVFIRVCGCCCRLKVNQTKARRVLQPALLVIVTGQWRGNSSRSASPFDEWVESPPLFSFFRAVILSKRASNISCALIHLFDCYPFSFLSL